MSVKRLIALNPRDLKLKLSEQENIQLVLIAVVRIEIDIVISIPILIGYNMIQELMGNYYASLRDYYICK